MRVLVLGGGVIGVTTAYYLARDGHEVTVVERHPAAAGETSYANAGLVAPAHAYAWASPKAPKILFKSLVMKDQALRLKLRADPRMWRWGMQFLAQCTEERARINTLRKLRLCLYSVERLNEVVADTGVAYDGLEKGNLYLYRTEQSLEKGVAHTAILREQGVEMRVLDRDGLAGIEPALDPVKDRLAGGMHAPGDQSGDARMFTRNLASHCAEHLGVRFEYDTRVTALVASGDRIEGVATERGDRDADAFVLAAGHESPFLCAPIDVKLPIYPCKGYSITVPVGQSNLSPKIGMVDEDHLVAFCPMGSRLRITSTAEFSGYDKSHSTEDFRAMFDVARSLFPGGGDYSTPEYWAGLRPMTPTTVPIFGFARYRNLMLNVGHGHIGWTMACGSARVVSDLLAGRDPGIDLDGMLHC